MQRTRSKTVLYLRFIRIGPAELIMKYLFICSLMLSISIGCNRVASNGRELSAYDYAPYQEGLNCYNSGIRAEANPYTGKPGHESSAWLRGWVDGKNNYHRKVED